MTSLLAPICLGCARYREQNGAVFTCDAYPEAIPQEIIESQIDHRQPYAGDHDLQFVALTPADEAYATSLFETLTAPMPEE